LIVALLLTSLAVIMPKAAKADSIVVNPIPGNTNTYGPSMSWRFALGSGGQHYNYVGAFGDLTGDPWNNPQRAYATEVNTTVHFYLPNPSMMGTGNWLAGGMFAQEQGGISGCDGNFYSAIAVDNGGNMYLSIGVIWDFEYLSTLGHPFIIQTFMKEYTISGISTSVYPATAITLTMKWDCPSSGWVSWFLTINGQQYLTSGNSYNVGHWYNDNTIPYNHSFCVGDIYDDMGSNCYYMQFGIYSRTPTLTDPVSYVIIDSPMYYNNGWNSFPYAFAINGGSSYTDNTWMWGGNDYNNVNVTGCFDTAVFYNCPGCTLGDQNGNWMQVWSPPVRHGGCVLQGTRILMADGETLPVQAVKPGDTIRGYDVQTGKFIPETVTSNNCTIVDNILSLNKGMLYLTPRDQPIYTDHGWIRNPQDLKIGWKIYSPTKNAWITVNSLENLKGHYRVYDVVATQPDTFIGNGLLLDRKPIPI
jgi:hypothetical protein